MALTKALGDSNAAPGGGSMDENSGGDIGMNGYTQVPFPSQMPAKSNGDVGITKNIGTIHPNQGTSAGAYAVQPDKVNAKTGA